MSDKVTVDISPIANNITVAPITTSVEIVNNTTSVELTSVTYENNITQSVTNVDITPTKTTVEATVNTTTVDISPNTTTVGVGDASIVASNLAIATNTSHDSNSWITGGNVQVSFDNLATTADSRYVNVTGDTMTGELIVPRLKVERDNGTAVISLHDNTDDDDHVIYLTGMVNGSAQNIFSLGTNDTTNQFQLHSWLNRDFEFTFGSNKHVDAVATISTSGLDVAGTITFDGGTTSADLDFGDGDRARFGDSQDLQVYHNGSSSIIKDATGHQIYMQSTGFNLSNSSGLKHIYANEDYGVTFYYQDSPKLVTTSTGVSVTGTVTATAFSGPLTGNVTGQVSDLSNHTFFSGDYADLSNKPTLYSDSAVDTHLNQSTANNNEVLSWNGSDYDWVAQSGGIALTSLSVNGTEGTASGNGGIAYDNTTGVFTYTPPDLSSFLTSETSHADVLVDGDFTQNGFMKRTGAGTYTVDTNTYLTSETSHDDVLVDGDFTENGFMKRTGAGTYTVDTNTYLTSETSHADVLVDGDFTENGFMKRTGAGTYTVDTNTYLTSETSHADVLVDGDFTENGFMKRTGAGTYTVDTNTYLTEYTETDPVVGAINGIVKANGNGNISAAVAGTDYSTLALGTSATTALAGNSGINALSDVSTSSIAQGNVLFYDSNTSTFKPSTVTNGGVIAAQGMRSYISSAQYGVFEAGQSSGGTPHSLLQIGSGVTSSNDFSEIRMQPGLNGLRVHWYQEFEDDGDANNDETLRLHTTNRGIHVGDDRIGTYTAGDLQSNADTDFGMLAGRESTNAGSNNFGFGYKHTFAAGTASNFAAGSSHTCSTTGSNNNFFAGGDNKLSVSGDNNFCGGVRTDTKNNTNFTWAEGVIGDQGQEYRAKNYGTGCTLFGKQTEIDGNCTYSLVGGDVDGSFDATTLASSHESILWGEHQTMSNANSSIAVGSGNTVRRVAGGTAAFGYSNVVGPSAGDQTFGMVVGGTGHNVDSAVSAVFGSSNTVNLVDSTANLVGGNNNLIEGSYNLCAGQDNNSIGESAACLGKNLKTPLFQPVVDVNGVLTEQGDYVWDNYSVVVGAFNDEAHKYHTVYPTDGTVPTAWVEDHRFVVGTGTATTSKANGFIVAVSDSDFSGIIMPALAASTSHANGAAAKTAGVPVGGLYHTNGVVKVVLAGD